MFRRTYDTHPGLEIRYTEPEDGKYVLKWFKEPETGRWFPMHEMSEKEDAAERWVMFHKYKCSLTATMHGVPCGIATLYLQPYRKLAHHCEFGIIVGDGFRNLGIGSVLLTALMELAKENFRVEVLSLQVYGENPAIPMYKSLGFREFGRQSHFIKETGGAYVARVFMERFL